MKKSSYFLFLFLLGFGLTGCQEHQDLILDVESLRLEQSFDILATSTDGRRYEAEDATQVPAAIRDIIKGHAKKGSDIVFLIDNTSSMDDDIAEVKRSLADILGDLPEDVQVGAATYNDANETTFWYDWTDLNEDIDAVNRFIQAIPTFGGGDAPESVYDGIYETADRMNWRENSNKVLMVIGDAPPLEGVLSRYTLEEVITKCQSVGIDINLYPILIKNG